MGGYSISKKLDCSYDEGVERAREALAAEGFGVLTEIDVKATIKKKLDKNFRKYIILGACNPGYAFRALNSEKEVGLFLPCNVIVYEDDDAMTVVSAIDPIAAMSATDNPELAMIANEVAEALTRVIESL